MSYDTEKTKVARIGFIRFRLKLDVNDPALNDEFALDMDSYNTPKTTNDVRAYTGVDFQEYCYTDQNIKGCNPGLVSANSKFPTVAPGKNIGDRGTCTVTLKDFISSDIEELPAPYDNRRVKGRHFAKMFARNYLRNREAFIDRGYMDKDGNILGYETESYIVDSFSGSDIGGNVKFSLVDPLILTDETKAKAPIQSTIRLLLPINETVTTLDFVADGVQSFGDKGIDGLIMVGDTGVVRLGSELMEYEVLSFDSGTKLGTLTLFRGAGGSTASDHSLDTTIQGCLNYDNENITDIITELLTDYTKIDNAYIPDLTSLKNGELSTYNLTNIVSSPKSIKDLFNELVVIGGLIVFFDNLNQIISISTNPSDSEPVITFNETEHILAGSLKFSNEPNKQITRQAIDWDKEDYTENNENKNFNKGLLVIDGNVEAPEGEGETREQKTVSANWLRNTQEDNILAATIVQRNVSRFSVLPRSIKFDVDSRYVNTLENGNRMWLGSPIEVNSELFIAPNAQPIPQLAQVLNLKHGGLNNPDRWTVSALTYVANIPANVDYYIEESDIDYILSNEFDFSEAREYVVVINEGVIISSSSTAATAFSQGAFAVGATLRLINRGQIVGAGGNGGTSTVDATDGSIGGDALEFTTDTILDNTFGFIGGGGGGGAGGQGDTTGGPEPEDLSGGGGGAGRGQIGAFGGNSFSDPLQNGTNSTINFAGTGGITTNGQENGGDGGEFGEQGGTTSGAVGGLPGNAITTNGNIVDIIAGNNTAQIKGPVV